jgi:phospholipase C
VTLNHNMSVSAVFTKTALPMLMVTLSGTGSGAVTSNPVGINCGTACAASFPTGTQVVLTQTPAANSTFAGWGGACSGTGGCTVTLDGNATVSATFTATAAPMLTVTLPGTDAGTVTSNPAGINCPTTCSASFSPGTQVTLTETPGAPSTFSTFAGWGGACSGNSTTCALTIVNNAQATATFSPAINHIVIAVQENRSFDHYFGALREYWAQNGYPDQSFDGLPQFNPASGAPPLYGPPPTNPGCNPSSGDCLFDPSNPVTSFHLITQCVERPVSLWDQSHIDWDYNDPTGQYPAVLNGYVWNAAQTAESQKFYDTQGIRAMGYYDGGTPNNPGDLNYYYFMASNFATSDRWFTPVMTRTNSNREYLVAATSQGYVYPVGSNQYDQKPLTATTIFQELQGAGISWKIYVNPEGSTCTGPPYDPTCLLGLSYISSFAWGQTIPTDYPQNIGTIQDYQNDLANGTLPQVVEFEPASDAGFDEHPSDYDNQPSDIQRGANYIATQIIGPLMASPYWKDTAYIQTYDEAGGFYDHVSPQSTVSPDGIPPLDLDPGDICTTQSGPTCDFVYTGYRAAMMVISPYTRKNYVSHTVADTTAILKMIETRFNLPNLTARDAAQMDMTEFFDFSNPPWMTPPTPPAQNTNGPCYVNKLP